MKIAHRLLSFLLLGGAAAASTLPPGLVACADEDNDRQRLACYDREIAALRGDAPGVAEPAEPAASLEGEFGIEPRHEAPREKLDELEAVLTEVAETASGKRIFTLDNGQVWAEQVLTPRLRVMPGDRVRITAGSLGSFRLFGSGRTSTRVERVE